MLCSIFMHFTMKLNIEIDSDAHQNPGLPSASTAKQDTQNQSDAILAAVPKKDLRAAH